MNHDAIRVLIVEDEPQIRRVVRLAVEEEGGVGIETGDLAQGLAAAAASQPQLVILDLGLPDGNGVELIRNLRGWSEIPVLILSARTQEAAKIEALDAGADDYLCKPFGVGELRARVRALLRRQGRAAGGGQPLVECGAFTVDLPRRLILRHGEAVHLTPREYRLLLAFLAQPGKVLTQRSLLREVWGAAAVESGHYLRVYVARLRQKLEDDPTQPRHFLTETGVGYRFQP